MKPRVVLVNDTSLFERHFGCELVGQTFREQFSRCQLHLIGALPRDFDTDDHHALLSSADLVVVNGEGSIHHGKNRHLVEIASRYPSVLVNSVYQQNPADPTLSDFYYLSARESLSAGEIRSHGLTCDTTPDLVFASMALRSFVRTPPDNAVGSTDSIRVKKVRYGPIKLRRAYGFRPDKPVAEYLRELCSYERLCIGRFHAVVAATVLEIPFSTWDSNTWKTKALMTDMGIPELHFETYDEALANVPSAFSPRAKVFSVEAEKKIHKMFDSIAEIARSLR